MTSGKTAAYWIEKLSLVRHPEGGWFRETYRSGEMFDGAALPARFTAPRSFATSIFFLLERSVISALHRLKATKSGISTAGRASMSTC